MHCRPHTTGYLQQLSMHDHISMCCLLLSYTLRMTHSHDLRRHCLWVGREAARTSVDTPLWFIMMMICLLR